MQRSTPRNWMFGFPLAAGLALVVGFAAAPVAAQTSGSDGEADLPKPSETEGETGETEERSLRDRLEYLLSGYHFEPDRETFEGLAPADDIARTLRDIAADSSARPSLRTRAVDALAMYPSDGTDTFLRSYLEPAGDDLSGKHRRAYRVVRLHAISTLAEIHEGEKVVDLLGDLLEGDRLQVRLMVVDALGRHGGDAGRRKLRAFADSTEDDTLLREIEKFVDLEK